MALGGTVWNIPMDNAQKISVHGTLPDAKKRCNKFISVPELLGVGCPLGPTIVHRMPWAYEC
jgi:hypothetical protein